MAVLASDDFNRADGSLGANWTLSTAIGGASFTIFSNTATITADQDTGEYYNTVTWPADQYAEVVFSTAGTHGDLGTGMGVCCRLAADQQTYYRAVASTLGYEVAKFIDGAYTQLATSAGTTFANGDTLRFSVVGTTWTLYKNGAQVATGTDNAIASGNAGLVYSSSTTGDPPSVTSWAGGSPDSAESPPRTYPQLVQGGLY